MTKVTHTQAKRFTIGKQRMTVLGNLMTLQNWTSSGLQLTQNQAFQEYSVLKNTILEEDN